MFPTAENPLTRYKYASLEFTFKKDLREIERATYHLLDWLGDCGGLLDALFFLTEYLVLPFTTFALRERLLS